MYSVSENNVDQQAIFTFSVVETVLRTGVLIYK